jgi:solute carrier family 44 protein 1 (choline transporter-like protein)
MGAMETVKADYPPVRRMHYTPFQWALIVLYGFSVLWSVEFVHSSSQYIIAWVAQRWYFTPYAEVSGRLVKKGKPRCALFQGFYNLLRYHLGTVVVGSLVIFFLRPLRIVLGICKGPASDDSDNANPASNCLGACCRLFQEPEYILGFDKNAYIEVSVNSGCIFDSARKSRMTMSHGIQFSSTVLNSVQFIFQIGGVGLSTAVGTCASFLALTDLHAFDAPPSRYFVFDKSVVVYTTMAFSFYVGCAFMVLFDTVSDALFYCYILDVTALGEEEEQDGWLGCVAAPSIPGWLLWGESDDDDDLDGEPGRVVYAPTQLQKFMENHGVHTEPDRPD